MYYSLVNIGAAKTKFLKGTFSWKIELKQNYDDHVVNYHI